MSHRSGVFLVLSLAFVFALGASPTFAQGLGGQSVDQAELDRLARLAPADQRRPANQARLQRWFFQQAGFYQGRILSSALGRSVLVNVGPPVSPPGGAYSGTFAAPAGRGAFVVLYTDDVTTPSTFEETSSIEFPRSAPVVPMDGGTPSTCWHESLHAIMTGAPLGVRVEDFGTVSSLSRNSIYREAQEHVYIELFAEKAADWIAGLSGFERVAVAAAEQIEELRSRGRTITFEVERFAWATARAEWQTRWENGGRYIKRLPKPIRDEFERASSTRFPNVEEAIGFYMGGDFRAPVGSKLAGSPIRVPEWVMWPRAVGMPVLMEEQGRKGPELKAGIYSASFGVSFSEPRWRKHAEVTRGTAVVTLRSDDLSARVAVAYRGQPVSPSNPQPGSSWRRFVVKLGGPSAPGAPPEPIRVTVSAKESPGSASAKQPILPVHVAYRDDPPPKASSGPVYLETEGIFLVKLPVTVAVSSAPAESSDASSGPRTGVFASNKVVISLPTGHVWYNVPPSPGQYAEVPLSWKGHAFFAEVRPAGSDPGGKKVLSWLRGTVSADGQSLVGVEGGYEELLDISSRMVRTVEVKFDRIPFDEKLTAAERSAIPAERPYSFKRPFPGGLEARFVTFTGSFAKEQQSAAATKGGPVIVSFSRDPRYPAPVYGGTSSGPAQIAAPTPPVEPSDSGAGSIESRLPPPPAIGKAFDDAPPEPGELDGGGGGGTGGAGGPGGSTAPEPTARPVEVRWYVHPLGDYRIRLDRGWKQVTPGRIDGLDQLENGAGPWTLFPSRKRALTSDPSGQAERIVADWTAESPGARRIDLKVAGERAVALGKASKENGKPIVSWHLLLTRKDRLFYFSAFTPATTGMERLPAELTTLLSTLEFLTGSKPEPGPGTSGAPAAPGKPEVITLVKQGVELHDQKRFSEAIAVLDRALALDPGSTEAWRRRAMSKREQGDVSGAIADFDEAIRLDPMEPTSWAGRGRSKEKAGDADGALSDYGHAILLDPAYQRAWGYRATLRLARKDFKGAASDLDAALRLDPPAEWAAWAHGTRGLAREKLGDLEGARQDYRRALDRGSTDEKVRSRLERIK